MPSGRWAGSTRRDTLPRDWARIRTQVFRRDGYRCTEETAMGRCTEVATDCDHLGEPTDHRLEMLTSLCGPHHAAKSSRQGVQARQARAAGRRRPPEPSAARLR